MESQPILPRCRFRSLRRNRSGRHDCLSPLLVHGSAGATDSVCLTCPYVDLTEEAWLKSRGLTAFPNGRRIYTDRQYRDFILAANSEDFDRSVLEPLRQEVLLDMSVMPANWSEPVTTPPTQRRTVAFDAGLAAGTQITTPDGSILVEHLRAGDVIATIDDATVGQAVVTQVVRYRGRATVVDSTAGRLLALPSQPVATSTGRVVAVADLNRQVVLLAVKDNEVEKVFIDQVRELPTPVRIVTVLFDRPTTFLANRVAVQGGVTTKHALPPVGTGVTPPP